MSTPNTAQFQAMISKPAQAVGPCDWEVYDAATGRRVLFLRGQTRTFQQAKGQTTRAMHALRRAYRLGRQHGRRSGEF